jgi:hypothetical protein
MTAVIHKLYPEEPMPTIYEQLEYDLDQLEMATEKVAAYQNHTLQHCPCFDDRGRKVGVAVRIEKVQKSLRMTSARSNPYNQGVIR